MKGGYGICLNEWALDKSIKTELGLLIIISSLSAANGYCYASNEYLSKVFNVDEVTISRRIKKLIEKGYIIAEYDRKGALITNRKLRLTKMLTAINKTVNGTINKSVKDNNISNINNTSIKKNIEERKTEFKNSLLPYLNDFGKDMLNDFFLYWTEHGAKDKKMRFEKEKSFGLSRRLGTWKKNSKKYDTPTNENISIMDKVNAKLGL